MDRNSKALLAAVDSGIDYLRSRQRDDGTWSDFDIGIWGSSDEWVTAYVCCALARLESNGVQALKARASRAITRRQRPNGGWGYNNIIPADADSTSFAIRAVFENDTGCDWDKAWTFLIEHQRDANGGFATYSSENELQDLDERIGREKRSFAGWCSIHLDVTASVLESLSILRPHEANEVPSSLRFLRKSQDCDGLWRGYWATDAYYPTYRAVVALRRYRPASDSQFDRAAKALNAKQHEDGSWRPAASTLGCPFRTALASETLLLVDGRIDAIEAATQWLLDDQRENGSWASTVPFLRIPPPSILSPDEYEGWGPDGSGRGAMYVDARNILTTATVLSYLATHLQKSV